MLNLEHLRLQRYYKKCTYASEARNYFEKKIDIYLTARSTATESLLASRCIAGCERGIADFSKKCEIIWGPHELRE